jgi:protein-tyrosine phosphatase
VFEDVVRREGFEAEIESDSAGTTAFHVGSPPDRRAYSTALGRGIDLDGQWARQLAPADLQDFDYLLVMDRGNYEDVLVLAQEGGMEANFGMFLDYASEIPDDEIPDPYYGNGNGFERTMDLAEVASAGLLRDIKQRYLQANGV